MRKALVVGIIILFLLISIYPSSAINIAKDSIIPFNNGKTIYVDDDNTEGPWDGTKEHPYQYIQDGVRNANEGDTVYVFNGTYIEKVKIYSVINLIGEDKNITIIDANYSNSAVQIESNYVTLSGFTLRNSGPEEWHDSGVHLGTIANYANQCYIFNNKMINNFDGIYALFSKHNHFENNIIMNNKHNGITIHGDSSAYNKFINNTIQNNSYGGIVTYEGGRYTISGNIITNNGEYGIRVSGSIIYRNIIKNHKYGIIDTGFEAHIYHNSIEDNYIGIRSDCKESKIEINNFINNDIHATFFIPLPQPGFFRNQWKWNYWDNHITRLPKIICGVMLVIPKIEIDFFPAQEPYDIYNPQGCDIE